MSRVRGIIYDRQTMRSFNMGGILFDFPGPVSPLRPRCSTRYFLCDFFPQDLDIANGIYWNCRVSYHDHIRALIMKHAPVTVTSSSSDPPFLSTIPAPTSAGRSAHHRRCHHVRLANTQRVSRS